MLQAPSCRSQEAECSNQVDHERKEASNDEVLLLFTIEVINKGLDELGVQDGFWRVREDRDKVLKFSSSSIAPLLGPVNTEHFHYHIPSLPALALLRARVAFCDLQV